MLRKYEGCIGRRGTSAGEDAPTPAPARVCSRSRVYIRAGRAGSCKLGKELRTMGIVGCGIMMAGLMSWALLGCIGLGTGFIGIGTLLVAGACIQEKRKEKQAQAWRKNYPSYKY